MSNGKGDKRRPCNQKQYDRNYIAIFGKDCKNCVGTGKVTVLHPHPSKVDPNKVWNSHSTEDCPFCDGIGRIDKYARK